jgi:hypothetical protein
MVMAGIHKEVSVLYLCAMPFLLVVGATLLLLISLSSELPLETQRWTCMSHVYYMTLEASPCPDSNGANEILWNLHLE